MPTTSNIRTASSKNCPREMLIAIAATLALAVIIALMPSSGRTQERSTGHGQNNLLPPILTESPRDTITTFLRLTKELETVLLEYQRSPSLQGAARLTMLSGQFVELIDLSAVAAASRHETGVETFSYVIDIFGRIGAPDPTDFPDVDGITDKANQSFRIPHTPLRIVRMTDRERAGEFLFAGATVEVAPRFFQAVRQLPLRTGLHTDSMTNLIRQITGPLVPASLVRAVPPPLKELWWDTPIWKVISYLTISICVAASLLGLFGSVGRSSADRFSGLFFMALVPMSMLVATAIVLPYVAHQLNLSGRFAAFADRSETFLTYLGYAWLLWSAIRLLFELVILSPRIADKSLDANLLRLASGTIGIFGAAVVLAFGGQAIGLPILSVLAGLGIGGLAVALAVRPTLENLIGGVMLYVDRPVRVGDWCSFGDQTGTVEEIGIRSTRLRALDRTLITVPNAQFADMQIINWGACDQMLIHETIGVRYETTPDQLRYLLAELKRMVHAHPRIDSETIRVRFAGYGDSALNIEIRLYAMTREWNDFFAIREDVLLRVFNLVAEAGTSFAFPSQTLYMARDEGLDRMRTDAAQQTVVAWRKSRRLPFPDLTREEMDRLRGTLDYPPSGSPEADDGMVPEGLAAEPLSTPEPSADPPSTDESELNREP